MGSNRNVIALATREESAKVYDDQQHDDFAGDQAYIDSMWLSYTENPDIPLRVKVEAIKLLAIFVEAITDCDTKASIAEVKGHVEALGKLRDNPELLALLTEAENLQPYQLSQLIAAVVGIRQGTHRQRADGSIGTPRPNQGALGDSQPPNQGGQQSQGQTPPPPQGGGQGQQPANPPHQQPPAQPVQPPVQQPAPQPTPTPGNQGQQTRVQAPVPPQGGQQGGQTPPPPQGGGQGQQRPAKQPIHKRVAGAFSSGGNAQGNA